MAKFTIRTVNSTFRTSTPIDAADDAEAVFADAITGAIGVAADDIRKGMPASAVRVMLEDADERQIKSAVVTLSVAPLTID